MYSVLKETLTKKSCQNGDDALCRGNIDDAIDFYNEAINNNANEVLYLNRAFAYDLNAHDPTKTTDALRFINKQLKC